jgi:hypothetical protein
MPRDQTHDALGRAIDARDFRAATRVVEVSGKRRVARGETRANARGQLKQNARDTVPEQRVRGFRPVMKDARDDKLLVRTEPPKDSRGLSGMAVIRTGRAQVPRRLVHAVEHS